MLKYKNQQIFIYNHLDIISNNNLNYNLYIDNSLDYNNISLQIIEKLKKNC